MKNEHCMCADCLKAASELSDMLLAAGEAARLSPKDIVDGCMMTIVRLCVCNGLDPAETLQKLVPLCLAARDSNPEAFEPKVSGVGQA